MAVWNDVGNSDVASATTTSCALEQKRRGGTKPALRGVLHASRYGDAESGGLIRFADPDNPADYEDVQFTDDEVVWVAVGPEGKVDNRLTNIGTKRHRNYVVEFKRA